MYLYAYNSKKPRRSVHLINPITGRTYCSIENSTAFKSLDMVGENPADRPICTTCQNQLLKPNKKNKRRPKRKNDKIKAREALIKHFRLHKYATNIAICLCIHNECGLEMPLTDRDTIYFIIKYWRNLTGKTKSNKYNFMSSDKFYSSKKWREIRFIALQQTDGRCTLCGASAKDGVQLHVDHIKPRSKYPDKQFDLNNLQILCEDCNLGKSNYDETDFR